MRGAPYMVMEFVEGRSLQAHLADATLGPEEAIRLLMPAIEGVAAAHQAGIVHRDLKPANLLVCVDRDGTVYDTKVVDFGIALSMTRGKSRDLTESGTVVGTPQYMAPEQLQARDRVSELTDQHALALILYRMLTGRLPYAQQVYEALVIEIATCLPPTPCLFAPDLPRELGEVILRALEKRPEDRYPDLQSFATALEPFAAGRRFQPPRLAHARESILEMPRAEDSGAVRPSAPATARDGSDVGRIEPATTPQGDRSSQGETAMLRPIPRGTQERLDDTERRGDLSGATPTAAPSLSRGDASEDSPNDEAPVALPARKARKVVIACVGLALMGLLYYALRPRSDAGGHSETANEATVTEGVQEPAGAMSDATPPAGAREVPAATEPPAPEEPHEAEEVPATTPTEPESGAPTSTTAGDSALPDGVEPPTRGTNIEARPKAPRAGERGRQRTLRSISCIRFLMPFSSRPRPSLYLEPRVAAVALLVGLTLALWPQPRAAAEVAAVEPVSEDYQRLIEAAVRESAEGRWAEARGLFRQAYELMPNARAMRGVAMTSFELRDYTEAYRASVAALADERRPLDETQRAHMSDLRDRSAAFVGRFDASHLGRDVSLHVDGALRELEPDGTLLLPEGEHEVSARSPDGREARARWRVRAGDHRPLPIELPEPAPAEAATPAGEEGASSDPEPLESAPAEDPPREGDEATPAAISPSSPSALGVATLAGGGAVLAAGVALFSVGRRDLREVESAAEGSAYSRFRARAERAPRRTATGAALAGLGVAAIAVGVMLYTRRDPQTDEERATVILTPNGGVHAKVRF